MFYFTWFKEFCVQKAKMNRKATLFVRLPVRLLLYSKKRDSYICDNFQLLFLAAIKTNNKKSILSTVGTVFLIFGKFVLLLDNLYGILSIANSHLTGFFYSY